MTDNKRYYVRGKQYVPAESYALCSVNRGDLTDISSPMEQITLYRTQKGSYFLVSIGATGTRVNILNETEAFAFMDENSDDINVNIYDKLFGTPEKA